MSESNGLNVNLLLGEAKNVVKERHPSIYGDIVDAMATEVIRERTALLREAINAYDQLSRELNKIRPDQISYNATGEKVESWSAEQHKKKSELTEKVNKAAQTINDSFDPDKWDAEKLKKITKSSS